MRFPLLAPAITCLLLGTILVAALRELWWPAPWPPAPQRELVEPVLPVSSHGKPSHRTDVVALLRHKTPKGAACAENQCEAAEHWQVKLRLNGEAVQEVPAYPISLALDVFLRDQLLNAVAGNQKATDHPFLSAATLSIRAPANAPYGVVHSLIHVVRGSGTVAGSSIYRIEFAVTAQHRRAEERRLEVPLSHRGQRFGRPGEEQDVWVTLRWDRAAGVCVRCIEETDFPNDKAGDVQLQSFLKEWMVEQDRWRGPVTGGYLFAASDVPFQAVVDLIDLLRAAGIEQFEFRVSHEPK